MRALDPYLGYRKGPFALHALGEYIGVERVHTALRELLRTHSSGQPPLATTRDLYRQLQSVTPATEQGLLHDLFASNTFWQLITQRATARPTGDGSWQVTLQIQARKLAIDEAGVETQLPLEHDWIEVGVSAPAQPGERSGKRLYLQKHQLQSGQQTLTVTVPSPPAIAAIDPQYLLIDLQPEDNVQKVKLEPGP